MAPLAELVATQRRAFTAASMPTAGGRRDSLDRLMRAIDGAEGDLISAVAEDFGRRAEMETRLAELIPVRLAIRHARRHVAGWMAPRRVATDPIFWPGRCRIHPQPLGVVGIIAPWNYPIQLAVLPLVAALAAGNRAIVKPSELTPRVADVLDRALALQFGADEVAVVTGGADVARELTEQPLDHLFFTGSTAIGRKVAGAAARNLVPVTLELGGKSPAIIDDSADMEQAVRRIVRGKLFNAGQTCIAPDYAIVPEGRVEEVAEAALAAAARMYPDAVGARDATSIISARHRHRLEALLRDASGRGAHVRHLGDVGDAAGGGLMPLHVVTDVTADMDLMTEEVFGPVLPIVPAADLDAALGIVRSGPRPLALYWFGADAGRRRRVLDAAHAGGVTINDTLLHNVQENLPFGGVGESGIGAYHGVHGFDRLSHLKGVFRQSRRAGSDLLTPPYGRMARRVVEAIDWWSRR